MRTDSLHDYVVDQLQAAKGSWPEIARKSRVPKRTLEKIASRATADPRVSSVEKLARYFRRFEARDELF